jgi:hypothetical protein
MSRDKPKEEYTAEEAQRRFEQALRGALKTPHKPLTAEPKRPRVNLDRPKVDKTRNK